MLLSESLLTGPVPTSRTLILSRDSFIRKSKGGKEKRLKIYLHTHNQKIRHITYCCLNVRDLLCKQ